MVYNHKSSKKTNQDLDIFYINNIITLKIITLFIYYNNDTIKFLNKLSEWNLYFCIFFSIYNNNFKINDNIFTEKNKYFDKIRIK